MWADIHSRDGSTRLLLRAELHGVVAAFRTSQVRKRMQIQAGRRTLALEARVLLRSLGGDHKRRPPGAAAELGPHRLACVVHLHGTLESAA